MKTQTYQVRHSGKSPDHQKKSHDHTSDSFPIQTQQETQFVPTFNMPKGSIMANIQRSMDSGNYPYPTAPMMLQTKLTVGQREDFTSQVAQQRLTPKYPLKVSPNNENNQPILGKRANLVVQREENQESVLPSEKTSLTTTVIQRNFEENLNQAKGGGSPLDREFRAKIEPKMGADFSGVKIHTDSTANELSQSIQAKAFTTGKDIFFKQGEYNPHSKEGQETLAHELTHVVQQTGGSSQADQQIIHKASPQIQRLVSKGDFTRLAGEPSTKAKWDSSTYTNILACLEKYQKTNDNARKAELLTKLKTLCQEWINGHTQQTAQGDNKAIEHSDLRKADYITGLLKEVRIELGELPTTDRANTPSQIIGALRQEQQEALQEIEDQENDNPNANYHRLTLFAAIENPYLIKFAQKRLALRIENEKNKKKNKWTGGEQAILTSEEIKKRAAREVLEEEQGQQFQGMDLQQQAQAIKDLADASSAVGHTWVKLTAFDDPNGEPVKEHSFGFYPLQGYSRPELSVPGQVVYPDDIHKNDSTQLALDYNLTRKQYNQALELAIKQLNSPPEYKLIDYNCTLFAKKIVKAAGQQFPGNAFMTVPTGSISALTGLNQGKAFNPNALYEGLQSNLGSYVPQSAQEATQRAQQAAQQRQEEQKRESLIKILSENIKEEFTLKTAIECETSRGVPTTVEKGKKLRIHDVDDLDNEVWIEVAGMFTRLKVDPEVLYQAIADQIN